MKKIMFIILAIISIAVGLYYYRQHTLNQLITGGFGTQFKDSPYPFNQPDYPVGCNINTYKVDFINLTVQQGQVQLKIPADAMGSKGARKRADAKECQPVDLSLRFIFFNGRLLRNGNDYAEAKKAGYSSTGPKENHQTVKVRLIDLLDTPAQAKAKAEVIRRQTDLKRYTERMRMKHFPLWFYPNALYIEQERFNAIKSALPPYLNYKYGYGVLDSLNPLTNQPYFVECGIDIGNNFTRKTPDNQQMRNNVINATSMFNTASGVCKGKYYVVTEQTIFTLKVSVDAPGVKNIDKIYAQLDEVIKSYLVRSKNHPTTHTNNWQPLDINANRNYYDI